MVASVSQRDSIDATWSSAEGGVRSGAEDHCIHLKQSGQSPTRTTYPGVAAAEKWDQLMRTWPFLLCLTAVLCPLTGVHPTDLPPHPPADRNVVGSRGVG